MLRTAVLAAGIAIGMGSFASVASAATIITNWQNPVPYSFVSFGNPVIINGSYTLQATWVGTIYVIQDGVQLPQELTIDNSLGATSKTADFTINLGTQPPLPSPHNIQLEFFGGTADYINGKVQGNATNNADEYTVPRTYTASGSPDPVLRLSYDAAGTQPLSSPALNFANTVVNVPSDRTIYVHNVGGGNATGVASVSSGENPFYCVPSCAYAIPAGAAAVPITLRYLPNIVNMTDNAMLNFSCTAANCSGINAAITGNSVKDPQLPVINLDRLTFDFGMQNINKPPQDQVLTVTNTGGGILIGNLSIPGSDFTCVANATCQFTVSAGSNQKITIRFDPQTPGIKNVSVPETSNGGNNVINLLGWGNNKPIQDINCLGCAGQYNWAIGTIAIASTANTDVAITNRGVGDVTGFLNPTPGSWTSKGWSCTSVTEPDGSIVTPPPNQPCQYYGVKNGGNPAVAHMSYTALSPTGPVSDSVNFKSTSVSGNDNSLSMSAFVILGQLNIGVGYDFWVNPTLVNNVAHPAGPSTFPISFTNQGGSPMVVTLTLPTGAGVFTCNIAGTPCVLDTPNTFTLGPSGSGSETKTINMYFAPTAPSAYTQIFTVCVLGDCGTYTMHGQGQDPRIGVSEVPVGGHDQDKWTVCAVQWGTCTFSGTQTVYYGNSISVASKVYTNSVGCNNSSFGDPTPGIYKYCWVANTENGTWINTPWKTAMTYEFKNAGVGGRVEYNITSATHFKCNIIYSFCSGSLTNYDNKTYTYNYDVKRDYIYFNPTQPIFVSEPIIIKYDFVPDYNNPGITDCPSNGKYCHTMTLTNQGTGLSGPKLNAYVTSFPVTNVGAKSTAVLVVQNTGTDNLTNIKVSNGTGPFTCFSTCGPYDLVPGATYGSTIEYTASAGGTQNGTAIVTLNELPPVTVPLQATGNALAQIDVTPGPPGFLDYGTVDEGSQATSGNGTVAPIIVTNTGAAPLSGNATITSGNANFKCITCFYGPLNPGESAEVKISFVPTNIGPLSGTVSFSGGGGATLSIFGVGRLGASSFSSTDANFGRVLIKTGNFKEQVVTIVNNGSVAVTAGTISWSGTSGGMFTCVAPTPVDATGKCMYPNIAPNGGTVSFTIRFTPTSPGSKKDTIKFSGSANAKVSVFGIGVVPSVKFKEK